jgi:glycosyltransferase involved in cell wall biosynthesis
VSVAVVIPTRNMAATLERAVLSASNADEIHVIDDASTDDTAAVLARLPVKVIVWRWPKKSRDHVTAQRVVYDAIDADQIIGLGADDVLLPGFVEAVRFNASQPVVMTDYHVMSPDGSYMWTVTQEVVEPTLLTPDEMRARVESPRNATESGVGSSLRRDVLQWLWAHGWDRLGPHMDSIGVATAACTFGCLILPIVGAAYTLTDRSYARNESEAAEDTIKRRGVACRDFMQRCGLPDSTVRALCLKRCSVKWS